MDVLLALGITAKELFNYNRENFRFDKKQGIQRDILRMDMQVKRFQLMREDVRDLVDITAARMDMFHMIGSLFLHFCIIFFCSGRMKPNQVPQFIVSMYLLSNACAFVYLLLAVWLSANATIASKSYGVRLLTRFVRLPIPTMEELERVAAKLTQYEQGGLNQILRVPLVGGVAAEKAHDLIKAEDAQKGDIVATPVPVKHPEILVSTAAEHMQGKSAISRQGAEYSGGIQHSDTQMTLQMKAAEEQASRELFDAATKSDDAIGSQGIRPGKHVRLFHELQGRWQPYDAYCRVCMHVGTILILNTLSYYSIAHTLVENNSPGAGFAMVLTFQGAAVLITWLDIDRLDWKRMVVLDAVRMAPCVLTLLEVVFAVRDPKTGRITPAVRRGFYFAPLCLFFWTAWLQLFLKWVAKPDPQTGLPVTLKSIAFLDVFKDEGFSGHKKKKRRVAKSQRGGASSENSEDGSEEDEVSNALKEMQLIDILKKGNQAIARWREIPHDWLSDEQRREVSSIEEAFHVEETALRKILKQSVDEYTITGGEPLSTLVGPLEYYTDHIQEYHYCVERCEAIWDIKADPMAQVRPVLTLLRVRRILEDLQGASREYSAMTDGSTNIGSHVQVARVPLLHKPFGEREDGEESTLDRLMNRLKRFALKNWKGFLSNARLLLRPGPSSGPDPGLHGPRTTVRIKQDLVAAKKGGPPPIKVEMGPWRVILWVTRWGQIALVIAFFFVFLDEIFNWAMFGGGEEEIFIYDGDEGGEDRRLAWVSSVLIFDEVALQWPHGALVDPVGLSCHPGGWLAPEALLLNVDGDTHHGPRPERVDLLISSPFVHYATTLGSTTAVASMAQNWPVVRELRGRAPAAQLLCADMLVLYGRRRAPCVWGALAPNRKVTLWTFDTGHTDASAISLPIDGEPWRLFAGAGVRCSAVANIMPAGFGDASAVEWCLVLAGWDGQRLSVAAVPLADGLGLPPLVGSRVRPRMEVPLGRGEVRQSFTALYVEPASLRLWALTATGFIVAWDLLVPRSLGRWQPKWARGDGTTFPVALCESSASGRIFLAGRDASGRPHLLSAGQPPACTAEAAEAKAASQRSSMFAN